MEKFRSRDFLSTLLVDAFIMYIKIKYADTMIFRVPCFRASCRPCYSYSMNLRPDYVLPAVPEYEVKICPPSELAARIAVLPRPLVFTNGCFDILHRGHATYLAQARSLGAALVVAVNSDDSVKRLGKGKKTGERPINPLADRLSLLAALESVSLVTWFDQDTPLQRIIECRPDILVKGGDWSIAQIVGATEVSTWGGSVYSIPFVHQTSTTAVLEKIRSL